MAKKAQPKKRVYLSDDVKVRQWCIDEAIRWPVITHPNGDADVIGRAKKIYEWVSE